MEAEILSPSAWWSKNKFTTLLQNKQTAQLKMEANLLLGFNWGDGNSFAFLPKEKFAWQKNIISGMKIIYLLSICTHIYGRIEWLKHNVKWKICREKKYENMKIWYVIFRFEFEQEVLVGQIFLSQFASCIFGYFFNGCVANLKNHKYFRLKFSLNSHKQRNCARFSVFSWWTHSRS